MPVGRKGRNSTRQSESMVSLELIRVAFVNRCFVLFFVHIFHIRIQILAVLFVFLLLFLLPFAGSIGRQGRCARRVRVLSL